MEPKNSGPAVNPNTSIVDVALPDTWRLDAPVHEPPTQTQAPSAAVLSVAPAIPAPSPVAPAPPAATGDDAEALSLESEPASPTVDTAPLPQATELSDMPSPSPESTDVSDYQRRSRFSVFRFNRQALVLTGAMVLVLLLVTSGAWLLFAGSKNRTGGGTPVANYAVGSKLNVEDATLSPELRVGQADQLTINGRLEVRDTLVLSPTSTPGKPIQGQIYYDKATNALYYYNGTEFVGLGSQTGVTSVGGGAGAISLGQGLTLIGNQLSLSSSVVQQIASASGVNGPRVTSLQGQTGDVVLSAGSGISINGTVFSNSGVVSLVAGTPNLTVTNDGHGNYTVSNASGAGSVSSITGTANQINVSSSTGNVVLSLPQDIAATSTPTFGGLTLSGAAANGILYANGSGAVQSTASASNSVLVTDGTGNPQLSQTLPLAVQANITATGTLNSGAITAGFGAISTVNNITTTALIQGGSLTITGGSFTVDTSGNVVTTGTMTIQGAAGLSLGVAGSTAGSLVFSNAANSHFTTLQGLAPTGQDQTITIPASTVATDEVCLLQLGNCVGTGGGVTTIGTQNYIPKFTNAAANQIGNSLLYDNGVAIGLGTSSPALGYLLDVNGNINVSGTAQLGTGLTVTSGGASITGNISQVGVGAFSTGTGAVSLNGSTTVAGSNTFTVGTGASNLGGSLQVTGLATLSGGAAISSSATIVGTTDINTTGTANTFIGNATGTFSVTSTGLNVSAGGALSGVTGYSQASGNFSQSGGGTFSTGTGAVSLNGNTTVAGTLAVQGAGGLILTAGSHTTAIRAASAGQDQVITVPDSGTTADTLCLQTLGNCAGASGSAGGDLTGTYPNPTIAKLQGTTLTISSLASGQVLQYNGSAFVNGLITNSNLQAGAFANITGVGALTSGSIASGFGNIDIGTNTFTGNGSGLTNLNGSAISSGIVGDTYLSANVTLQGNTFNGPSQLVKLTAGGLLPALNGSLLTNLNGSAISSGTVANTYLVNGGALTVSAGTGLNGGGSVALGGTTTLNVTYGATANTSAQGNTAISFNGSGNLTGTVSGTAGGGITTNTLAIVSSPTFSGDLAVQGSGGVTIGAVGTTDGLLRLANSTNSNLAILQAGAPSGTGNATYTLPSIAGGSSDVICLVAAGNCAGSGGGVVGSGTTGTIALFSGTNAIGDSTLAQSGSTVTASGNLVIQGANSLSLGTASSNTGAVTFNNSTNGNTLTLQSGATSGNLTFTLPTADGSNGYCLTTNGSGTLAFTSCTGGSGGGVTSLDGLIGVLTLNNSSGSGTAITIDDASTSQKGIAQFNSTNFSVSGGVVNTIQNIATSSSPVFVSPNGTTGINTGAGAGTQRIDASGNLANIGTINASGAVTAGTYNGQTISSTASFTGTVAIQGANALTLGTTGTASGAIVFKGSTAASGTVTLQGPANPSTSNYTLSIPTLTSNDTICTATSNTCTASGSAGGDLTGTYPNPTIAKLQGTTLTISSLASGQVLQYNGSAFVNGLITNSNLQSGTFGNVTGTGNLNAGSIISGFGTITTANTITGTTLNGTTGINTGAGAGTQRIDASGNLVNIGNLTGSGALAVTAGGTAQNLVLNASTSGQIQIGGTSTGDILLGGGSSSTGCTVTNSTGDFTCTGGLTTGGELFISRSSTSSNAMEIRATADTNDRLKVQVGGTINWGDGSSPVDTNLYRSTGNTLKTDGNFIAGGTLTVSSTINGATISGGTISGGSLSASAVNGLSVSGGTITNPTITGTVTGTSNPTITGFGTYNGQTISSTASFTGTVAIQGANSLTLGTASSATGAILFKGSGGGGTLTLQGPTTPAGSFTLNIPAITANANICTDNSICSGYAAASASGAYIQKNAADTSSASVVGTLLGLTNTNTGAANVLGLTNSGSNSALSILQNGAVNPGAGQALVLANNNATTPTGNLLDLQNKGTSEFHVDVSGNSTQLGLATTVGLNAQSGLIQGAAGLTITGGVVNLNASSNNTTNINTGTSTGAVNIGGGSTGAVTIQSASTVSLASGTTLNLTSTGSNAINITPGGGSNTGVVVKPGTDSTSAFQVQNAGSASLLNVDTANQIITVGSTSATNPSGGGTVGSWNTTSSLPTAVYGASTVAANGYMYQIGGYNGSAGISTTYYAVINANGTLGSWTSTTALPTTLYNSTAVVNDGFIYVMGGYTGSSELATVYYAKINSNGTIGTWNTTTSLPSARQLTTSAVNNGFVYVLGGSSGGTGLTTVYYASFNANGSLGTWNITTSIPAARVGATTVVNNGYIYEVTGGTTPSCTPAGTSTAYYAVLNTDGSIGAWGSTSGVPDSRYGANAVIWGSHFYLVGGTTTSGGCSPGYLYHDTDANTNGTLNAWGGPSAVDQVFLATAVGYNGYMYMLGGTTNGTTNASSTVYYVSVSGTQGSSGSTPLAVNGNIQGINITASGGLQVAGISYFGSGLSTNNPMGAPVTVNGITLGSGSGSVSPLTQVHSSVIGNDVQLNTYMLRTSAGSDWTTASIILQRTVDGSGQGYLSFSSAGSGGFICVNITTCTHSLGVNGTIGAASTITASTTPDISETIPASDDVTPGDVVSADPNGDTHAIRSSVPYDSTTIGVISDGSSSFRINSNAGSENAPDTGKYLVLAGRVPVHVTDENGPIEPGDYLTTSSTPGYAMKATHAGPTIGKALAAFDGTSGTVMTQTNLSYYGGPTDTESLQNGGNAVFNDLTVGGTAQFANLNVSGLASVHDLTVTGSATIADLTVTGNARIAGNITISGHVITNGSAPSAQAQAAAGGSATCTVTGNDTGGTVTITTGGAGLTDGQQCTLTFHTNFDEAPNPVIAARNKVSAQTQAFVDADTHTMTIEFANAPDPNTTYTFNYFNTQ